MADPTTPWLQEIVLYFSPNLTVEKCAVQAGGVALFSAAF
jgi:hypothetical protein